MGRGTTGKKEAGRWIEAGGKGLWSLCLGVGTILLLAGKDLPTPGIGLALTGTAFFWRVRGAGRIRAILKWMIPIFIFLAAYGLILHLTSSADASAPFSARPPGRMAHIFLRSMRMLFALFALEEVLRPLALRARTGGSTGGRMTLMLGLAYQLVPVFLQSLEGIALSQRACSRLWWLRPSCLLRAVSSLFLLSQRFSEEMALSLSLRIRREGPAGARSLRDRIGSS